ncbi:endoplasmic reticulum metallopeptidase 1 isoform X1 [Sceloporus undulatus]|uniref:endoplasmic reticulum metallopeptidase 1 isoform X1 n=1 Tax=Sceloporus undulatus TaxID=8520 RepID=UPI001C4C27C1|nr:endoplasmic reticulum metallopeptidase 1 isoform X1 [Sceloporus undulatus]
MERSSAAVGAVRRLRTQQHQHQQQKREEEEDEEWRRKRRRKAGGGGRLPHPLLLLPESRAAPLLLLYLLALRGLVHVSFQQLVRPAPAGGAREFNAPRARAYLENITAIGPRAVGSPENEIFTVNYLLEQVKVIEQESSHVHRISVDVQRPTGTFSIDFLGGFTSYYDNITNVVVKLEPRSGAEHAVLANCHFDSVPNTLGASDDAVSCSVMLEILHTLSKSSEPLKHAVIFLFNGAEESLLQASHGFITQHHWAKSVRAFINLEAAGVGGKELVFQTGPENPWLVQAYISAAKHPFGCVVAQEVFQSGVIPAETDFRIYRDFGNVPGIDLAFIENGYIYHTKYDTADRILTDSIQRAGDNILGVLKYLATSDKLARSHEYRHGNIVFFDVFGMFVLAYPARVGAIMNYVITALAVLYLGKKVLQPRKRAVSYAKELAIAVVLTVLSWLVTLLGVLTVAVFISLIGRCLSWYTHFYVSVFLYGTAALAKLIFVHTLAKTFYYKHTNEQFLAEIFFDVPVVFWSISLALLTYLGVSSAFVSAIWVAFPLLTKLMTYKELNEKGATMKFITVYLLGMFIPHLYLLYLNWIIFEMFVPIMGRSGSEIPPDIIVAAFIVLMCVLLSSYLLKFIYLAKSTKRTIITLTTVSAITFTLVCSGIFFPYSSDAANPRPKRVFLQHMSRRFHRLDGLLERSDSGIWINGLDYDGISHVTPHIPELNDSIRTKCEEESPLCGLPWILPVDYLFRKNWYLPAPATTPKKPVHFQLLSKEQMPWDSTKLTFEVSGPSHMSLYLRPHQGSTLSRWSLGDGTPVANAVGGDYFVFYSHGLQALPWQFWIEFKASDEPTKGMVTLAIVTHYFFGEDQKSPQLHALIERFPNWTFPSGWVSTYDQFIF